MPAAPTHRSQVSGSPWPGIYAAQMVSGRHYGRHAHDYFGFGVLEQGAQRSSSGRRIVDAHAGDILTHNPGEMHDGRPLACEARAWRMVYVEPEVMASLASEAAESHAEVTLALPVLSDAPMRAAVLQLHANLAQWQAGRQDALACEEALVQACRHLLARNSTHSAKQEPEAPANLERARQRLADDLQVAPTLAELAALAGLSRYQVLRRFAATYGVPPHTWLMQRRAEHARALIRQGSGLAQAAAASGFADQSHMTRIFARQFGFTPGAWQRAQARPQ
jgi:AraC-like DNA-binding protein